MIRKKRLILSFVLSCGMMLFSYWVTNLHYPISGEKGVITNFSVVHDYFYPPRQTADSVLLVNVSYDRQLVPIDRDSLRMIPIVDRRKLLTFLNELRCRDDYRYIMLDVIFGDERTEADSALFATIADMRDIIFFCDKEDSLITSKLKPKAGQAYYNPTRIESNFVKYPYWMNGKKNMPLKMYEELTGRYICKHGPIYLDGNYLVRSSIVLNIDFVPQEEFADSGNVQVWHDLGAVIDKVPIKEGADTIWCIDELNTEGKYVVIGYFKDVDIHSTYRGDLSGAVINFNAFQALMAGHHRVSLPVGMLLFVSFFVFGYLIFSQQKLSEVLATPIVRNKLWLRIGQRTLVALCSWIGFSLYLSILCVMTYVFLGEVYDIFITSTMFWAINVIVKLKYKYCHEH